LKILLGYQNLLPIYLSDKDMVTHLHGQGLTRQGKSKLIEFICQQLIKEYKPFCLIDPHGSLYRELLAWLAPGNYSRPIVLFNPSSTKRIVGFNPFLSPYDDEARLMTKAERLVTSVLRIWGAENPNSYSNIERWLRCIFYVILEQKLSIGAIRYFIYWHQKDERTNLIGKIKSQSIQDQLLDFYSVPEWKFKQDIESTRNKLQKFIHPQMRRIMGLPYNNISVDRIVQENRILLCNFQAAEDEVIGAENTRVLGTLLLSELWESFRKRTKPSDFYLIIDECHQFIGPDIQQTLTGSAKYGLRILLFHQYDGQIKDIAGAMKNAQTKITFSTEDSPKKQRHFTLRRANHQTIDAEVPVLPTYSASKKQLDSYEEYLTQHFLTTQEVDALLNPVDTSRQHDTLEEEYIQWKPKPQE